MKISLSIVSHGQGILVKNLLREVQKSNLIHYEIILTLNIPEDEKFLNEFTDLPIKLIRNKKRKGFGSNHNSAFKISAGNYFLVINPDILFSDYDLKPVIDFLENNPSIGVCAPLVRSVSGLLEDSVRRDPTFPIILKRVFNRFASIKNLSDFTSTGAPLEIDWAAGMFLIFRKNAFNDVGGFDEHYFMYYEDADICKRLRRMGWKIFLYPQFSVIHEAQRASAKNLSHLKWHLESLIRILFL
jgi:N-acetylglucosaminyl-diphospho-decaprenol L-rhamnosyltransferase